jgi:hypothetical protein
MLEGKKSDSGLGCLLGQLVGKTLSVFCPCEKSRVFEKKPVFSIAIDLATNPSEIQARTDNQPTGSQDTKSAG